VGVQLHILSGSLKNRVIKKIPPVKEHQNFTSQVIKEAVFEILNNSQIPEKSQFIDLFSGSGQMALEAYSRGYKNIYIYEKNRSRRQFISNLIESWNLDNSCFHAFSCDFELALKKIDYHHQCVIFLDPPYGIKRKKRSYLEIAFRFLFKSLQPGSIAIAQAGTVELNSLQDKFVTRGNSPEDKQPQGIKENSWTLEKRNYGSQGILILKML
jgi:16S rRNA G966 N2-methylase RsmD